MKDRLLQFIKKEKLSSSDLAEKIGVQPSTISHILSGRNNPSYEFIENFLKIFPSVNAEWLIMGKGDMYKDIQHAVVPPTNEITAATSTPAMLEKQKEKTDISSKKAALIEKIIVYYDDHTFQEFISG
jgi:transcriptional regulator with XRE-family HTH domain